jgi:hypothetical protein
LVVLLRNATHQEKTKGHLDLALAKKSQDHKVEVEKKGRGGQQYSRT